MNSTWNLLKSRLEQNKKELIEELSQEFIDDDFFKKSSYGCCGRIKNLPGMFYVNCSRNGNPCVFTGRGVNDKSHYYWIPIVHKFDNLINNYIVSLVREDLDVVTGNAHHNFTEIQIVKNLYGSPEIGGAYNPSPKKDGDNYIIKHQFFIPIRVLYLRKMLKNHEVMILRKFLFWTWKIKIILQIKPQNLFGN